MFSFRTLINCFLHFWEFHLECFLCELYFSESLYECISFENDFAVAGKIWDGIFAELLIEHSLQGSDQTHHQSHIRQCQSISYQEVSEFEVLLEGCECFLELIDYDAEGADVAVLVTEYYLR